LTGKATVGARHCTGCMSLTDSVIHLHAPWRNSCNPRHLTALWHHLPVENTLSLQDSAAGSTAEPSIFEAWDDASYNEMEAYLAKYDIEILSASEEDGRHHVAADGLLADEHCGHLIQLDVMCI